MILCITTQKHFQYNFFPFVTMKLISWIIIFYSLVGASYEDEGKISKVICLFKRFTNTDIFENEFMPDRKKLSKRLFKECNLQVRIVSDQTQIGKNDFISFAYQENDNKETL